MLGDKKKVENAAEKTGEAVGRGVKKGTKAVNDFGKGIKKGIKKKNRGLFLFSSKRTKREKYLFYLLGFAISWRMRAGFYFYRYSRKNYSSTHRTYLARHASLPRLNLKLAWWKSSFLLRPQIDL
jgi:hypothetical protein